MTQPDTSYRTRIRKAVGVDQFKKDCEAPLFVTMIVGLIILSALLGWRYL